MKNYYEVLGVQRSADEVVIRAAFKALAQRYHPDKWQHDLDDATRRMKEINLAYETLSDAVKRKQYDEEMGLFDDESSPKEKDNDIKTNSENTPRKIEHWKIAVIFLTLALSITYVELKDRETLLITLKCNEDLQIMDEKNNINYYKITKKFFEIKPYQIYTSNPNYDLKDFPPYLVGVSIDSSPVAQRDFPSREHFPPDWYTFVTPDLENLNGIPKTGVATYVNRVTLAHEVRFLADGRIWSTGSCEIVNSEEFESDWKKKVRNKKEKLKF